MNIIGKLVNKMKVKQCNLIKTKVLYLCGGFKQSHCTTSVSSYLGSSGIMGVCCFALNIRADASMVWQLSLTLMNNFNKTEAANFRIHAILLGDFSLFSNLFITRF